ncbi:hypothetical protein LP420_04100 [Massilia sp. B-10]|nr:hypothetical protein LP420_04100 [Massilia sp. B-10]
MLGEHGGAHDELVEVGFDLGFDGIEVFLFGFAVLGKVALNGSDLGGNIGRFLLLQE